MPCRLNEQRLELLSLPSPPTPAHVPAFAVPLSLTSFTGIPLHIRSHRVPVSTSLCVNYDRKLPSLLAPISLASHILNLSAATVATAAATVTILKASAPSLAATPISTTTHFSGGDVELSDPFSVPCFSGESLELHTPRLLGSGGSGAVYAFSRPDGDDVAVKYSWVRSAASVGNECAILRVLESERVGGVVRCIGQAEYGEGRVVVVTEPVIEEVVEMGDIAEALREGVVRQIVRTMVQMLGAKVGSSDVQILLSRDGQVLFVDFTEAKVVDKVEALDLAFLASFVSEMMAFVPADLEGVAKVALCEELKAVEGRGGRFGDEIFGLLVGQGLVSEELIDLR